MSHCSVSTAGVQLLKFPIWERIPLEERPVQVGFLNDIPSSTHVQSVHIVSATWGSLIKPSWCCSGPHHYIWSQGLNLPPNLNYSSVMCHYVDLAVGQWGSHWDWHCPGTTHPQRIPRVCRSGSCGLLLICLNHLTLPSFLPTAEHILPGIHSCLDADDEVFHLAALHLSIPALFLVNCFPLIPAGGQSGTVHGIGHSVAKDIQRSAPTSLQSHSSKAPCCCLLIST